VRWQGTILASIVLWLAGPCWALDKVSLQLKWLHQFQFAKDHSKDHDPRGIGGVEQNTCRANPEIGVAFFDRLHGIDIGTALANFDFKPGVPIKTVLQGGVIACELKLMQPL